MASLNRLEMRNISIVFGRFATLTSVDFVSEGKSVHALTGANGAGKSTLMAVLSGAHSHYSGEILLDSVLVSIRSPREAKQLGINLVQQEVDIALVPQLSVAENILLDRLAEPGHRYRWSEICRQARALLAQLEVTLDVKRSACRPL